MGLVSKLANRNINIKSPDWGFWYEPGAVVSPVGKGLDHTRATIFEWPIIWFATAYLYHNALVKGTDRSFWFSDWFLVTLVSFLVKRFAVGARWRDARWEL
jgi:hypothetical protein